MKIKKTAIEKAVRKANREGRQFCAMDWRYGYCVMIDTEDAEIWCDTFSNCNDFKVYHSDTIDKLTVDGRTATEAEKNMVDEAIEMLKNAGWEVED